MGWLKPDVKASSAGAQGLSDSAGSHQPSSIEAVNTEQVGVAPSEGYTLLELPTPGEHLLLDTPNARLPFIDASQVHEQKRTHQRLWIVIDQVVYDCTDFVHRHPGGSTVIESFRGEDCSWQFWRFHNHRHLKLEGSALRVGRTQGVENRFKERPAFIGLRRLGGNDDW